MYTLYFFFVPSRVSASNVLNSRWLRRPSAQQARGCSGKLSAAASYDSELVEWGRLRGLHSAGHVRFQRLCVRLGVEVAGCREAGGGRRKPFLFRRP